MDPETLVTFLFKAPTQVRIVELLGSWDNFTQPYQMHHDRRRGTGTWSGCFRFENIIFDGDTPCWHKPRSGGLKQGGVYWYYYRLDYDVEAYDDMLACTTNCPLMPGQTVNVLDVPTEIVQPPSRSRSACYDGIAGTLGALTSMKKQTLEPSDKFAALEPPPISRVHGRCISDLALNGRLEGHVPSARQSLASPLLSLCEDQGREETLDRRPSKRRCSGDLPPSSGARIGDQSPGRSCRLASVVDAYAAGSPAEEPHPDPLRSLPVDGEMRNSFRAGLETFDCDLASSSAVRTDDEEYEEDRGDDDKGRESAYSPRSVHNVQMYGSPPTKACDPDREWRPGLYSLPSESLIERPAVQHGESRVATGASTNGAIIQSLDLQDKLDAETFQPLDATASGAEDDWRPRMIHDADAAEHSPHPHADSCTKPAAEPDAHHDSDEVWSPTFSAATVSSNGGLNTPFRLSIGYSRDTTAHTTDPQALDDITQRLHSLGSTAVSPRGSPSRPRALFGPERSTFTGYALPPEPAMQRVQSLGKVSPASNGTIAGRELGVPTLVLEPSGNSMVDDIFSELGYLGGSIN